MGCVLVAASRNTWQNGGTVALESMNARKAASEVDASGCSQRTADQGCGSSWCTTAGTADKQQYSKERSSLKQNETDLHGVHVGVPEEERRHGLLVLVDELVERLRVRLYSSIPATDHEAA
jgi:hypothetical protein